MSDNALYGSPIADSMLEQISRQVNDYKKQGWAANLASIAVGDTLAVDVYIRNQRRCAQKAGIGFQERHFPSDVSQQQLKVVIGEMNINPLINGIIIQRPVPEHLNLKDLQTCIHPLKDVEGMHPASIGNIVYNELDMAPCTASAAIKLLKSTNVKIQGLEIVVVGHSAIVGKPAAFLLMAQGATVTVCHHMTVNMNKHLKDTDVVIVATGVPRLITGDMVKENAIVIDVGINRVIDKDGKKKIVGDVDYKSVQPIASHITPVPGGVGPVTVAMLMHNTITALKRQRTTYTNKYGITTPKF